MSETAKMLSARELAEEREYRYVALAYAQRGEPWVYFIESCGCVKIGHSKNIPKRISEFRQGSAAPIILLGIARGGVEIEKGLHKILDEDGVERSHGEWFRLDARLRNMIKRLCDQHVGGFDG